MFFIDQINTIQMDFFPSGRMFTSVFFQQYYSFVDIDIIMPACRALFDTFHPLSYDVLSSLIRKLNKTTCVLDPFPTKLLMSHLSSILDIIICIVILGWEPIVTNFLCHQLVRIVQTLFLNVHSFIPLHANATN